VLEVVCGTVDLYRAKERAEQRGVNHDLTGKEKSD